MRRLVEAFARPRGRDRESLETVGSSSGKPATATLLGAEPLLAIDGVLEVGELRSILDATSFGVIETTADSSVLGDAAVSGALGTLRARTLRLNSGSLATDGVLARFNTQFLVLNTPGGAINGDAKLIVDEFIVDELITGLPIATGRSGWYPPGLDGGGAGFVEVDADNVKLDLAGASCGTKPIQGVRLRIVDGDQIGVQLQCGAAPGQ